MYVEVHRCYSTTPRYTFMIYTRDDIHALVRVAVAIDEVLRFILSIQAVLFIINYILIKHFLFVLELLKR